MASETEGSGDFPHAYIRFRTVLDGLELTAMRYFLKDNDEAQRIARAQELENLLMPIINEYQNKMNSSLAASQDVCPEGMNSCNGCCVPYNCP